MHKKVSKTLLHWQTQSPIHNKGLQDTTTLQNTVSSTPKIESARDRTEDLWIASHTEVQRANPLRYGSRMDMQV